MSQKLLFKATDTVGPPTMCQALWRHSLLCPSSPLRPNLHYYKCYNVMGSFLSLSPDSELIQAGTSHCRVDAPEEFTVVRGHRQWFLNAGLIASESPEYLVQVHIPQTWNGVTPYSLRVIRDPFCLPSRMIEAL